MAYDWRRQTVAVDPSKPQASQQGSAVYSQQARDQGYKGGYVLPQNFADAAGQNFGQATQILQSGFSGQSDPTTQYQDQLRSAALSRIGGLQNNAEQRKQAMTADLERGFANQANILRRSAAGTGSGASLGYGRAAGDLANQFQQNLSKGLLDVENQATGELGQLGGIGQQLFSQELANRQQAYNQAQDLAGMYQDWSNVESGRDQAAAAQAAAATAARKQAQAALIGSILQTGGMVAGSAVGPGGALAGRRAGSAVAGGIQ